MTLSSEQVVAARSEAQPPGRGVECRRRLSVDVDRRGDQTMALED
jgi:hypothetical protein